jgi:hypothetical protein
MTLSRTAQPGPAGKNPVFPLSPHSFEADNSSYSALLFRTIQKVFVSLREQRDIKIYGEENE